jgi:hypothetical protein
MFPREEQVRGTPIRAVVAGDQRWRPCTGCAFAGHRDGVFRPLRDIHMRLVMPHGEFRYRVLHTLIVNPEDVWVLSGVPRVNLTLLRVSRSLTSATRRGVSWFKQRGCRPSTLKYTTLDLFACGRSYRRSSLTFTSLGQQVRLSCSTAGFALDCDSAGT